MKKAIYSILCISLLFVFACSSDESNNDNGNFPDNNSNVNTDELIANLITSVTSDSENIWKIDSATLTNSSVTDLDVSNTFNIVDDEFVFKTVANSQTISLEHKQGNDINANATSLNDFLLDYYKSSISSSLSITDINSKTFGTTNKAFVLNDNETINATYTIGDATLTMVLSQKTAEDYPEIPTSLNFTEVTTINEGFSLGIVGFTGANQSNSLYIAFRETPVTRILKYSLDDNSLFEGVSDTNWDFVTKRLLVINNKLKVFGSKYLTTYDLDVNSNPSFIEYNLLTTRFGFTTVNDDIYFVGGGPLQDTSIQTRDKIKKYNEDSNTAEISSIIPSHKVWADAELVNNKIYIFGGQSNFVTDNPDPQSLCYIHDLETGSYTSFDLPEALFSSYAVRYQNLIYVAGNIAIDVDNNGNFEDYNDFFGVYNTLDNTFTEIETNVSDSGTNTIKGMTIFNGKIYILHGDNESSKIYVADL